MPCLPLPALLLRLQRPRLLPPWLPLPAPSLPLSWPIAPERTPIGAIREHPNAGSWRLAGKASPPAGGPARWLWESAA